MNDKKIYLTKEGLADIQKERDELVNVKRPEILERLSDARDQGDLSENAEYTAAKDELSFIDGRIDEIEEILKQVTIIEEKAGKEKIVSLGSTVTVKVGNKEEEFTLVGEFEADPTKKRLSNESPVGQKLLGAREGDSFEVEAPAGKVKYTIVAIH